MISSFGKRAFDLLVAIPALLCMSPIMLAIGVMIRLHDGAPSLFVQERIGRFGRTFSCLKFRTMVRGAEAKGRGLEVESADARITRLGRWLRPWALDELPQLFNVIAGSMSLVGPRPLIEWESQECMARHAERFHVKPGITGLSQVTVRNSVDLDGRSDKDVEYVRDWSLTLDLWILMQTPRVILHGAGIYPEEQR